MSDKNIRRIYRQIATGCAGLLLTAIFAGPLAAQSILQKITFRDISEEADVRTTILRDQERSALVIRTIIAGLAVTSNNTIFSIDSSSAGRMVVLLSPGTHRLRFHAPGIVPSFHRLFFPPGRVKGLAVETEAARQSLLRVNSQPEQAEVLLDGQVRGKTPVDIKELPPGKYTLLIRKQGFRSYLSPVEVRAGEEHAVFAALEHQAAHRLEISTKSLTASVFVNEIAFGQTPFEQQFPAGDSLNIVLKMPGYSDVQRSIVLNGDQHLVVDFDRESQPLVQGNNRKWLLWAGGAATIAGAATYILLRGEEPELSDPDGIGQPGFPGEQ